MSACCISTSNQRTVNAETEDRYFFNNVGFNSGAISSTEYPQLVGNTETY